MPYFGLRNLTVLRGILRDDVVSSLNGCLISGSDIDRSVFLHSLYLCGGENNLTEYIQNVILYDENPVSVAFANKKTPSDYLLKAYKGDLGRIFGAINAVAPFGEFSIGCFSAPFSADADETVKNLSEFYSRFGYGKFINNAAFNFENGELVPIKNTADISLSELKNYETEKNIIESNIVNFLHGLPYSHMLLYGDRGTGKSSTVHAMLKKYFPSGLRIIEINKENMLQIPKIRQHILANPLKFIIFIDDLSLNENDDKISALKASLEGSVSAATDNTMIVATSNRRHIVKESFSDRDNSVHAADSIQEQLSLSDRFGITVMFSTTDKQNYLSIVSQLAADVKLKLPTDELLSLAEKWAIVKGGRSPRRAKQFVDLAYSCEVKGEPIDF